MQRIYLDNAATSWPKPACVYDATLHAMRELGAPAGRSAYAEAAEVERLVRHTRLQLARLLGTSDPDRIVFTANATDALNLAIHGTLRPGDHVVTTVAEHNSVLRPLRTLEEAGRITVSVLECDRNGYVDPGDVEAAMRSQTRLIAVTHASNVTGAVQPVEAIGQLARQHEVLYLIDAAQTMGHWPLDVQAAGCSLLAAPAHKGLLGPLGLGFLYIAPGVEESLRSVRQGGTGTQSESDSQPETLPDKYEAGNLNVPAILGLRAGLDYLAQDQDQLQDRLRVVSERLLVGLLEVDGIVVHGPHDLSRRMGVITISLDGYEPQEVASVLDSAFRIQVRGGLHCAPRMHESLGLLNRGGGVRLSLGIFNTPEEIDRTLAALRDLANAETQRGE